MKLVGQIWSAIRSRLVRIIAQLDEAATSGYQIKCEFGTDLVRKLFDSHG